MKTVNKKYYLTIIAFVLSCCAFGQVMGEAKWETTKTLHWQDVEVVILKKKMDLSDEEYVGGEFILKTKSDISTVNDLTEKELKKIKKMAIKNHGVIVYLDVNNVSGYIGNGIYYFWLTE